jgi:O-antigen/teichoic acid export membrane protein
MKVSKTTNAHRLMSNTAWNVFTLVANAVFAFLLIRFFLRHLGQARFGLWVLVGSLFRYRGIFSMGLNTAVNRYVPMYLAAGDHTALRQALGTALRFYLCMAALCMAATAVLYSYIGHWFAIDQALVSQAQSLVAVVGLGFTFILPLQLATAVLSGMQRYDLVNGTVLAALVLRTGLLVVMLRAGFGLLCMGVIFAGSEVLVRVIHWKLATRQLPDLTWLGRGGHFTFLREMLAYGTHSFLYATGAVIMLKASDLIIGVSPLGMPGVTQFSIAAAAVMLLTQLVQAFTKAVMPAVSDLKTRGDQARLREVTFLAQKYTLLLLIPAVGFLVLLGRRFLGIWVGDQIGDPVVLQNMGAVLVLLALGHGIRLAQHSNYLVLVGCGTHRIFGWLTAGTALLVVILTILALWWGQGGLISVGWANCLPLVLISGLVLPVYFHHKMKIHWSDRWQQVWKPVLLGSWPGLAVLGLWAHFAPPDNWSQLLVGLALVAVAAVGGGLMLGCSVQERRRIPVPW